MKPNGILKGYKGVEKAFNSLLRELEKTKNPVAAKRIRSELLRFQAVGQVYLADLCEITIDNPLPSELELLFYKLWKQHFPKYGHPSVDDREAVKRLFRMVIYPAYPEADSIFFEKVFQHYVESTETWVVQFRQITTFCKNFRNFIPGPILKPSDTPLARMEKLKV